MQYFHKTSLFRVLLSNMMYMHSAISHWLNWDIWNGAIYYQVDASKKGTTTHNVIMKKWHLSNNAVFITLEVWIIMFHYSHAFQKNQSPSSYLHKFKAGLKRVWRRFKGVFPRRFYNKSKTLFVFPRRFLTNLFLWSNKHFCI